MKIYDFYLILSGLLLVSFTWYYLTLPGSILSPNKKHPKPSIKKALKSYLIYVIPILILNYYSIINKNNL